MEKLYIHYRGKKVSYTDPDMLAKKLEIPISQAKRIISDQTVSSDNLKKKMTGVNKAGELRIYKSGREYEVIRIEKPLNLNQYNKIKLANLIYINHVGTIDELCATVGISKNTYYSYNRRLKKMTEDQILELEKKIKVNKRKIKRIKNMKEEKIKSLNKKKKKILLL